MCCEMLKQSNSERRSMAVEQLVLSTWILKSPSRSVDEQIVQTVVRSSDRSDMKVVEALGGR